MRFCIQVVKEASVEIDGSRISSIGPGMLVLAGVGKEDDEAVADKLIAKLLKLRIFADSDGKTNLSINDIDGEILLVSQFTLYADCKKGNRPSFVKAGSPDHANALYEYIIEKCRERVPVVEKGSFGAEMAVELVNDGPFTVILDSDTL